MKSRRESYFLAITKEYSYIKKASSFWKLLFYKQPILKQHCIFMPFFIKKRHVKRIIFSLKSKRSLLTKITILKRFRMVLEPVKKITCVRKLFK